MIPELSPLQKVLSSFHSLACSHFVASSHTAPSAWKMFISPNLSHLTHFSMSRYNSDLHPSTLRTSQEAGAGSFLFIHCTHRASTLSTHTHTHTHTHTVTQLCLTVYNSMDCSRPGYSIHRILQARILDWVTIPFSRGSSLPRDQTQVSCIVSRFFTIWATREAPAHFLTRCND